MNYPSTTQALFALVVMIIVLLFILVYCCWGTFSCARQDDSSAAAEDGAGVNQQQRQQVVGNHMVIVPVNNMLYVGDPESHRIYQIPLEQDKPPAYTDVLNGGPPPPYTVDNSICNATTPNAPNVLPESRSLLPDLPPSYEECLSVRSSDQAWQTILNTIAGERRGNQNPEPTPQSVQAQPTSESENTTGSKKPSTPVQPTTTDELQDQRVPETPARRMEVVVLPASFMTITNPDSSSVNRDEVGSGTSPPPNVQFR